MSRKKKSKMDGITKMVVENNLSDGDEACLTDEQVLEVAQELQPQTITATTPHETVWIDAPEPPEVFTSGFLQTEDDFDAAIVEQRRGSEMTPLQDVLKDLGLECPFPGDPSMGDKDPDVVAWYRDNAPEEYARRYANRIIPQRLPEPPIESGPPKDFDDEEEPVKKPNVIMQ